MARMARVGAPSVPHQLTQRGNRRPETVVCEDDYRAYIHRMSQWCARWQVDVWVSGLMPNHVHLLVVPESEEGLRHAVGEAHRRDSRGLNVREGGRGHVWQGRVAAFPMDARSRLAAARYVARNPMRAGLVQTPHAYRWSSAPAHLAGRDGGRVQVKPLREMVGNWKALLASGLSADELQAMRRHETTGRPLGEDRCVHTLEAALGRMLDRQKLGRKQRRQGQCVWCPQKSRSPMTRTPINHA